ncbi:MAG: S8 family peptidase [Tsuneonella sp.]
MTAWQQGDTGQGKTIAIVDTGIDIDSPEFRGRISSASADVAGNRTIDAEDDHGTDVAMVAAAARDNTGVVGMAYGATILALRADQPGSCATQSDSDPKSGCVFDDPAIAAGIDRAVAAKATVINLSLGGSPPSADLQAAVKRAAAAGIVVVISAGNDGGSTDAGVDPNNPDPFAAGLLQAGGGNVIIVGSVDDQGVISDFSNRAGSLADAFLTARGEGICCVYENGVMKVETDATGSYVTLFSGTSFSAPQVAGAVALLAQAFPNLTGAQIVKILLSSARDAGAAGTDAVYGRGILDIARAFAPQGTTTLAGGTTTVSLGDTTAVGSPSMGDAFAQTGLSTVVLDGYKRAYNYNLGQGLRGASLAPRLAGAVATQGRQKVAASEKLALAFTVGDPSDEAAGWTRKLRLTQEDAEAARVLAAHAALKLSPTTQVGFAYRERADGLVAQLAGQDRPAFLIAGSARGDNGFAASSDTSLALRHTLGPWGLTFSAESGEAWLGAFRDAKDMVSRNREHRGTHSYALTADRRFGALDTALGATWLNEDRTILGAYLNDAFGAGGADTLFLDAGAGWHFAPGWRLGGEFRQGWTRAQRLGAIANGSNFVSRAWSVDLGKQAVFGPFDFLGLRVSQPLRVESGGLNLDLPVSYDYGSETAGYGLRSLSLAPQGREIDGELTWHGPLWGGDAAASLFYRTDPGNYAALPDDKGVALKWTAQF